MVWWSVRNEIYFIATPKKETSNNFPISAKGMAMGEAGPQYLSNIFPFITPHPKLWIGETRMENWNPNMV